MSDPYQTLGVTRSATAAEIKSAYRKLAKKYHPDLNQGGSKGVEQKFKEITAAYDLVSDPAKRAKYDRGEIDEQGQERGFHPRGGARYGTRSSSNGNGGSSPFGFGGGMGMDDILSEFFRGTTRQSGEAAPAEKGADVAYTMTVPFVEACLGGTKRLTLDSKKTIDVTIPAGTEDGHKLRLRGLGHAGVGGSGAAIIEIKVAPHPFFRREGNALHLDVPISLPEALLGEKVTIPTLDGSVALRVHKGANTGSVMRLKGKGIPNPKGEAGDMFATLKIMLPDGEDADLATLIEKWAKKKAYNPRKKLGWA